ncbi:hypothetical protein T03_5105 [Trichinella britovi]|uniref:MULE transposase domain-containing protein n=1 Tax=Trichinella britovi TaxID=45882 RepID=A0A0V1ARG4_TRIBR|nr:hypothetical protein T03_5105 [Trichinella britovi]
MEKKALLKKRSADETKPIPAIYDEEASAASAEPSTSGQFPVFKRVRAAMYKHRAKRFPRLPEHRHDLISLKQRSLGNEVQGCYFHFCQAVHRKVGELGLKTRYRQHEETRRKIRMLLATAFLPVPHVNTGVSLLEAGTTGTLAALFQYFRQEWMTDERLPLWNVYNVNTVESR